MTEEADLYRHLMELADNCSEAAARLRETDHPADLADAAAIAAAGAIHRAEAERIKPAAYWWQDRD